MLSRLLGKGRGGERLGVLFDCFVTLQSKLPESLYWVSPLREAEGHYVTTQFHHAAIRHYSGHEVVVFSREHSAYYWMPGARPNATGFVPPGVHRVELRLPESDRTVRLRFDKRHPTAFVLAHQGAEQEGPVQPVFPRPLPAPVINEELRELVYASLNFQVQALRAGVLRDRVASTMVDGTVAAACRNLSPRLDTVLGLLEDELASPGRNERTST